ncbi:MAG: chromosomal replication initiator protein DnaA [Roseburia sp.]|nr:chromosomal replication initiator protein DnaA [Anaeroplasma bactoclasticum]MCM1196239.1 chromosomal replication initiator protein DnaA [Roseburia sp.]MCM1556061.1 chromosomal replication initiator protein DnaA [Anaeroplasma bactoclasticum]
MDNYQDLWNQTRDILSSYFAEETFEEIFSEVKKVIKEENKIIYVLTPSNYIKTKINNIYARKIGEILSSITSERVKFKFVCEGEVQPKKIKELNFNKNNLKDNYTFESFVVGESNRFSYLTSLKVANQPGEVINPLYIFGGVGLGKTHLMNAIGNQIIENNIDNKVLYIQASDFITDYTRSIQVQNMASFYDKYENLDVLLVDDIQMLAQGNKSQQEFFKLFNDLIGRQKQIVITSDCQAKNLTGIMDRLTSRFQMGLSVEIQQPDLAQRISILKRKVLENSNKQLDDKILTFIAENFIDNVRELEGALNRLLLYSEAYNKELSLETAKDALEVLIKSQKAHGKNNYEAALSVISNTYSISTADLLGKARNAKYVLPRHIAMYILKNRYDFTYSKIGSIFNGRDHTTVMNGCTKIEEELKTNPQLKMAVDMILKKI